MHRSKVTLFLLSLLLVAAIAVDTRAQAVYGSISGTVTDAQGAVIPDATVTITNIDRNTSDTVQTNDAGLYVKDRLLPGTYKVTIEKSGYKQGLVTSVVVNVDAQANTDVALEPGQVTETVTISATEGQLLKTDRADVATTFETRQITDLPILDRNFTKFILLTPGTQQQSWQHASSENPQGSTQIVVNGQSFAGTGYQLDGTENRDPILGIIVINPTLESIGETKITSQNYDAEFGQAIAGVASVQTKSGTNDLHGSVFVFRQNDELQARNPFTQSAPDAVTGKLIPDTLKTEFGGSIGGRIIRDKLFYFGDYQGKRSKIGGTKLLNVPTRLARTGDFSEYGINIFDPLTRNQFSYQGRLNVIPPAGSPGCGVTISCLSPQALNILSLIPPPNTPGEQSGTRRNFGASGSQIEDADQFNIRIDGRVRGSLNIFGRYSFADYLVSGRGAFGQGGGAEFFTLTGDSKVRNQSLALGLDYTLTPTTILDMRFGYFKYNVNVRPFDFGTTPAADAGIPGLNLDEFSSGLFAGFVEGDRGFSFGSALGDNNGRCNCPLDEIEKQYQVVSNMTKLLGNHTVKFGVDVRRAFNLRIPSDAHRAGQLSFSDRRTASATGSGGLGIATFLLGDVTNFERYVGTSLNAEERQWRHFYYGQDTWRATPKLTVAYGLRLDVINPQSANEPANGGFTDIETGEVRVAGVGDIALNGNTENSLNFAPRLGVAYQVTDKTVIRFGYGRSYDIGVFGSVFGHNITQNLPVLARQQLRAASNFDRVFTLAGGPPTFTNFFGLTAPPNRGGVPNTAIPSNGRFFLPNNVSTRANPFKQRLPTVDAYNVTVQHQLTNTISVEAAYVGNKGTHVFAGNNPDENLNQASLVGFTAGVPRNNRRPFFNRFGWEQDVLLFCNCSDNRYDALQTKLTKRFSDGYSVLAHYTWQRGRDYNDDRFIPDAPPDLGLGPQDFLRTHVFVLSQVAELPFGRSKRYFGDASRALNFIVGGWQFNSNTTIQSGLPFNVNYADAGGDRDTGPNRPNLIGDPNTGGGSRDRWFNTTPIGQSGSAFERPAPGTFGNLSRNALRGPSYWRTDASLFKKFRFTETKELEFRAEVVNLFNHINLGQPDDTIGRPGADRPNAGRITGIASNDQMRNFQFALKFKF